MIRDAGCEMRDGHLAERWRSRRHNVALATGLPLCGATEFAECEV